MRDQTVKLTTDRGIVEVPANGAGDFFCAEHGPLPVGAGATDTVVVHTVALVTPTEVLAHFPVELSLIPSEGGRWEFRRTEGGAWGLEHYSTERFGKPDIGPSLHWDAERADMISD
jgi:hypothetical protein